MNNFGSNCPFDYKGAKSDAIHPFILKGDSFEKLTDVNFVYFMYPHHNTTMFKKIIKVDQKIQGFIIFGQIGVGHFFGKLTIITFVSLLCPIVKCSNLKNP